MSLTDAATLVHVNSEPLLYAKLAARDAATNASGGASCPLTAVYSAVGVSEMMDTAEKRICYSRCLYLSSDMVAWGSQGSFQGHMCLFY